MEVSVASVGNFVTFLIGKNSNFTSLFKSGSLEIRYFARHEFQENSKVLDSRRKDSC